MSSRDKSIRWTWNATDHPRVSEFVSSTASTRKWCDELETAASDKVTGKVLCVVAGVAIARAVIAKKYSGHERLQESVALLDLADAWIDDPADERFDQIARFLFDDEREWLESGDPLKIAWGALRVATSSVGNFEAGWALGIVVEDADEACVDALAISRKAIQTRSS
jgi:hypothetical protein